MVADSLSRLRCEGTKHDVIRTVCGFVTMGTDNAKRKVKG